MKEKGSRRKKIMRVLAAALVFCLLFTYPSIPDTLSVAAVRAAVSDVLRSVI